MEDLKALLVTTLSESTMDALLGVTSLDPRVYWYYNGDAEIDAEKPAFITYSMPNLGEAESVQVIVLTVMIWSKDIILTEAIAKRLVVLFDRQLLISASGRKCYCKVPSAVDQFQAEPQYAGRTMQVRITTQL